MNQVIAAWLTDTLPPESYDYIRWTVANYDTARPMGVSPVTVRRLEDCR